MYTNLDLTTRAQIRQGTSWGIAVGILLIILGIVGIALPFATAIALSLLFGWLFILEALPNSFMQSSPDGQGHSSGNCCWVCFIYWVEFLCCSLRHRRPHSQFDFGH